MKMKNDEIKANIQRLKAQVEEDEKVWLEYALRKRAKEKHTGSISQESSIFGLHASRHRLREAWRLSQIKTQGQGRSKEWRERWKAEEGRKEMNERKEISQGSASFLLRGNIDVKEGDVLNFQLDLDDEAMLLVQDVTHHKATTSVEGIFIPKAKPEPESNGTKIAREVRARCNNLSRTERDELMKKGMEIIKKSRKEK